MVASPFIGESTREEYSEGIMAKNTETIIMTYSEKRRLEKWK